MNEGTAETLSNKIDRIDRNVQSVVEDVIYIKAAKSPERIDAMEKKYDTLGASLASLKSQVSAQWLIIGIVVAIAAPIILKGLGV